MMASGTRFLEYRRTQRDSGPVDGYIAFEYQKLLSASPVARVSTPNIDSEESRVDWRRVLDRRS